MVAGTAESLYRDQSFGIFSKPARTLSSQGDSIFKGKIVSFLINSIICTNKVYNLRKIRITGSKTLVYLDHLITRCVSLFYNNVNNKL